MADTIDVEVAYAEPQRQFLRRITLPASATVADAIAWRCTRLSLGRTALEPKAGLGAKPEPMSVWVRHRVPTFNWILRGLLGAVPADGGVRIQQGVKVGVAAGDWAGRPP